jgi:phage terminase large subunit-like protein
VRELADRFEVRAVSFDPRFFADTAQRLADEGIPMVEVPQQTERMVPIVGRTFEMIKRGELSHDGDSLLAQQVLNAIPRHSERGFTLQKNKSRGRIDGAVALCLAVDQAVAQPVEATVPLAAWT